MPETMRTILLVEDDAIISMAESDSLQREGYAVLQAYNGVQAVEMVRSASKPIDLILMDIDLGLGKMDGPSAAREILKTHDIPILFLSSHTEKEIVDKTEAISSYGYVVKNSGDIVLFASIKMAFRLSAAYRDVYEHKTELEATMEELQATNEEFEQINLELEESQQELLEREKQLKESLSFVQATLESTLEGILAVDAHGRVLSYNQQFLDLWEIPEDVVQQRNDELLLQYVQKQLKDPDKFHETVREIYRSPENKTLDIIEFADGRLVERYSQPQYIDGMPVGRVWSFRNITERKLAEEKLRESNLRLNDIIEFLPDATCVIDSDKRIIAWNRAIQMITGIGKENLLGKGDYAYAVPFYGDERPMLIDFFDSPSVAEKYKNITIENGKVSGEISLDSAYNGRGADFSIVAAPLCDENGVRYGAIEVMRDITEKNRLEENYRLFAENSLDLITLHDRGGTLTYVSPSCKSIVGYDPEEILGVDPYDNIHPDDVAEVKRKHRTAIEEKAPAFLEYRYRCKDGSYVWFDTYFTPVLDDAGDVKRFIIVNRDITDRRKSEEALSQERAMTEAVLNSIPGLLYVYDLEGNLVRWNKKQETVTGYSAEEMRKMHVSDWFTGIPEDLAIAQEGIRHAFAEGESTVEARIVHRDGRRVLYQLTAVPFEMFGKKYFTGIGIDITEQKKKEQELRDNERRYRELFQNSRDAIFILEVHAGPRFLISDMNPSEKDLLGNNADDLLGRYFDEAVPPEIAAEPIARFSECVKCASVVFYEEEVSYNDWHYFFQTSLYPIPGDDGSVSRIIGISKNITPRKKVENDLIRAANENEVLMKELQHRVKNNLNLIANLVRLEAFKIKDEKVSEIFQSIERRIISMAGIYGQLYQSSEIDQVDLGDYIGKISSLLHATYSTGPLCFELTAAPEKILIDLKRAVILGLVINELIINSIKYAYPENGAGVVKIHLAKNNGRVSICVADEGKGFTESSKPSGTGLSLVSILMKQIGGSVVVEIQKGACVTISFPVEE